MDKVKAIFFRGRIKGRGIVNYDGKHGRKLMQQAGREDWRYGGGKGPLDNENAKVAKHSITKVSDRDDGKPVYDLAVKISNNCLRNAIFGEDFPIQNPEIMHVPELLYQTICSDAGLLRGFMFADADPTLKRKSPVIITEAIQCSNGASTVDLCTLSGFKRAKEDADDKSDISLHYKEAIGEIEYEFTGSLNLVDLQFVSMDEKYDRMAFDPDQYDLLGEKCIRQLFGETKEEKVGYFTARSSVAPLPEYGLLLGQSQVQKLVDAFFSRLLATQIFRGGGGVAEVSSLEIKMMRNPRHDRLFNDGGWVPVSSTEDIALSAEDIHVAYEQLSDEQAVVIEEKMGKYNQALKARKREKSREKKEQKERKKQGNVESDDATDATQGGLFAGPEEGKSDAA